MNLKEIQAELKIRNIDAWLFYDFHNRDAIAYSILGLENKHTTRRWFYLIPQKGNPVKIVSKVERTKLDPLPGKTFYYLSWKEQHSVLQKVLSPYKNIAMQYSPMNNIPYISIIDAGLFELIKSFGVNIVSSADLVSIFESRIDEQGYQSHIRAGKIIEKIKDDAFKKIRIHIDKNQPLSEYDLQQYILKSFKKNNLISSSAPIVGINEHQSDPHFEPNAKNPYYFKEGDMVLIDLWAKFNEPNAIYFDITWVGYVGKNPPKKYQQIFDVVKEARDTAVNFIKEKFAKKEKCYGWEVDDACRNVIEKAGFGKYFIHRTGHSIGTEVHGNGPNIDNLETKDERELLPGCCFSIEPGIYIDGKMAVRSEINVFIKNNYEVEVTGNTQQELILI